MNKKILTLLNNHLNSNLSLGMLYMQYYSVLNQTIFKNLAEFTKELANDKLTVHKDKIIEYICLSSADVQINPNLKYNADYKLTNPRQIVNKIYELEQSMFDEINHIAKESLVENDYQSFEFIQWFVKDVLKDFSEISYIKDLFKYDNDLLIDQQIKSK